MGMRSLNVENYTLPILFTQNLCGNMFLISLLFFLKNLMMCFEEPAIVLEKPDVVDIGGPSSPIHENPFAPDNSMLTIDRQ